MKLTSLFLVLGLAICQTAAAPKSKSKPKPKPNSPEAHVQWWTEPNFGGNDGSDNVNPGSCEDLESKYVNQIQSVQVDAGGSCNFFIATGCFGPNITIVGANPALPAPYAGNTSSYNCQLTSSPKFRF